MKIAYGLSGEGRGHSMRASALGTQLVAAGHEITFFTSGDAELPLTEKFGAQRIKFLPTPKFHLVDGKLNVFKTSVDFVKFMSSERRRILALSKMLKDENFDLVISDFEPLLSRAALNANIPIIAFNSQNFVNLCKIPLKYRHLSLPIHFVNSFIVPNCDYTVVSKPIRIQDKKHKNATLVGPMIRQHIIGEKWYGDKNHILMYRSHALDWPTEDIVEWANSKGLKVYFYGNLTPEEEKLVSEDFVHRPISETQFVKDMVDSKLVIGTSGTQLIGELAYLGIPAILIPEKGQTEQELNAYLANDSYSNMATISSQEATPEKLDELVATLDGLGIQHTEDGTKDAYAAIENWIKQLNT